MNVRDGLFKTLCMCIVMVYNSSWSALLERRLIQFIMPRFMVLTILGYERQNE